MSVPLAIFGDSTADHVAGLERLRGPVTVVRRCVELAELLAVCESGLAEVALIAGQLVDVPGHLLDRMTRAGIPVLVLTADREQVGRLTDLGARVLPPAITASDLAAAVVAAVADPRPRPGSGAAPGSTATGQRAAGTDPDGAAAGAAGGDPGGAFADPGADGPGHPPAAVPDTVDTVDGDDAGVVIAVWGPAGAPGRSTVAVNLAAELAAELGTAYLVDVDTYGSSTAVMLGLLDETAPLAQACRLADQGLLDTTALHRVAADVVIGGGRLRALTGITRPDRWPELRSSALGAVLNLCRTTARATVVDCGFCLEADEELSFDTVAPRRNGATLRSLELADVVLAVGAADAIGLPRLVKGIADLAEAVPTATPVVAINKVRRESVGRGSRQQVRAAWERYGPDLPIAVLLPADPAADAALLGGTVLRESAPGSALRAGIRALAPTGLGLRPVDAAARRRWFRRPVTAPDEAGHLHKNATDGWARRS